MLHVDPAMISSPTDEIVAKVPTKLAVQTGVSRGINTEPGAEDDGWSITDPVILSDDARVRLIKDGEALHCWYDAVCAAKKSIFLETYIFAHDETGRTFQRELIKKARAGVRAFVMYDSFGSNATDRALFDEMRAGGVHVCEFHPMLPWNCSYSWRPFNRNHSKLLIIDAKFVGLGGLNIANEYGGSWVSSADSDPEELWRDCGISLEGRVAADFATSFRRTWLYATHGGRFVRALTSHNLDGAKGPVGLLSSVPSMGSQLSRLLEQLLGGARKSIDLTAAYFAPADELIHLLCAAAKKGVQVRLMLPSRTDARIMITAARSFYEQLLEAGIVIYERQHVKLHAKTLVIDDEVSVLGSTNFDYRSIDYNCELAAVIRSSEFGQQMKALFEHDISFSKRIESKDWRHRPYMDRLVQWAVNRSRTLL